MEAHDAQKETNPVGTQYKTNTILTEGKTKVIWTCAENTDNVIIESKNDITGGDGARHDVIEGKAAIANETTCNVFNILKACNIPLAFQKQLDATRFLAKSCTMIPYEVIVRREAHGSYLKRNPHLKKEQLFPKLLVEFFLKTNNKQWNNTPIPKDDPFIRFHENKALLYRPDLPIYAQDACMILDAYPLQDQPELFDQISTIAKHTFLILEKAWQSVGKKLVDFKVEFGFDQEGNLLLADVIDNDSWRILENGHYIDKQVYREGGEINKVTQLYQHVRHLTRQFTMPKQQLIIWRASEKDNIESFIETAKRYLDKYITITTITTSMHKDPVKGYQVLNNYVQEIPDCVVIALVGRSNGAGPTLSANTSVPVITVPAGWKTFPEDVWSSLRTPSDTPVMTILEPQNAVLAALQILALRNPYVYALLRLKQEQRLINFVQVG